MSIKRTIVVGKSNRTKTSADNSANGDTIKRVKHISANTKIMFREPRVFKESGKKLIIVESPAKSKTIEKFLGKNYMVYASMGHLRDLPKSQLGVDVNDNFKPLYALLTTRKKTIDELIQAADNSSGVYLATDPDREGEAISWHLAHILNLNPEECTRITFNEITENAVNEAIKNPRHINMNMVNAQQARRVLDRLVGYKLSPLLWKKVCKGLSAGRVQSVAVRLVCEREEEIEKFVPEEYWSIEGEYSCKDSNGKDNILKAELTHIAGKKVEISNEEMAFNIKSALLNKIGYIQKIERKTRSRKAMPPFTTSTLQQEGVKKLNFPAKKTMLIAQHLYEGMDIGSLGHVGLITYMRTDSTRIAKEFQAATKEYITNRYGAEYCPTKPNIYTSKESAQDAHEAIRPTSLELTPEILESYLSRDELKLYTLIWNRFLASQMMPQINEVMSINIAVDDYTLRTSGSKVLFKGFSLVYEEQNKENENILPNVSENAAVENVNIEALQHFTQPPPRYSEASLIKTLEERGIGRPSTYAPILDTIIGRNYIEKIDKQFHPTDLGKIVVEFLIKHFDSIINVNFTAELETELDEVAEGKTTYEEIMREFYTAFEKELLEANSADKVKIADEESDEECELCHNKLVYKFGRYGKFLACSNFPECTFTKPINISTGIECPKCHKGEIIERKSKRGRVFYGCNQYPHCDFTMWNKPIAETCTECGALMEEKSYKNGTVKKQCSNEDCVTRPKRKSRKNKDDNK